MGFFKPTTKSVFEYQVNAMSSIPDDFDIDDILDNYYEISNKKERRLYYFKSTAFPIMNGHEEWSKAAPLAVSEHLKQTGNPNTILRYKYCYQGLYIIGHDNISNIRPEYYDEKICEKKGDVIEVSSFGSSPVPKTEMMEWLKHLKDHADVVKKRIQNFRNEQEKLLKSIPEGTKLVKLW